MTCTFLHSGILSAINGTGSVIGPIIGGVFASSPNRGWRWAFYFQLPIILAAAIATAIFLPRIGFSDRRMLKQKFKTIDYVGSVLFVGGSTLFLLGLLFLAPPSVPFTAPKVIVPFFVGLLLLLAFFFWEHKGAVQPIVPLAIFRNNAVNRIFVLNFVFGYVL